ncbi:MAG: hypothetical protein KGY44_03420 [Halanaerobiales bacterium]|nr:hypothetical protein [Halanaerobiales bacterium]
MYSILGKAIVDRNKEKIKTILHKLEYKDINFVKFVEEFAPLMLMEANLSFGNFHIIKMALFLKELSVDGYFSKDTEKKLIFMLALNLTEIHYINVKAERIGYKSNKADQNTLKRMINELDKGNVHNAFCYSLGLLKFEPEVLKNNLLLLGTEVISKSLGHSFSCFYPVLRDLLNESSIHDTTALFSYIMYLSRFNYDKGVHIQSDKSSFKNLENIIEISASGEGIVNLHHMITLTLFLLWEKDDVNGDYIPHHNFLEWISDKEVDQKQKDIIKNMKTELSIPENYDEFEELFNIKDIEKFLPLYFKLLKEDYKTAVDWIFKIYTNFYSPEWDPHYFTALYSALKLYQLDNSERKIPAKMSIYQALQYFSQRVDYEI